jgi:hypothetical protein
MKKMNPQERHMQKFPLVGAYVPRLVFEEMRKFCKHNNLSQSHYVSDLIIADIEKKVGKKFLHETQKFENKKR